MKKQVIKEQKQHKRKNARGITLITLVITIIVLMILATVSISVVFGDKGIIEQARKTKGEATNMVNSGNGSMNELLKEYEEMMKSDSEIENPGTEDTEPPVISEFKATEVTANSITVSVTATGNSGGTLKYEYRKGSESYTEGGSTYQFTGLTANTAYTLEVKVTDGAGLSDNEIITVTTDKGILPTDGSFDTEKGVNTPKIGSNMELVVFDEGKSTWVKDDTNSGYSYIDTSISGNKNKSEWANAKVTTQVNGQNVESYFVWIPRYAYKINGENDIDIVFIKGTGTEAADGKTTCKYADDSSLNLSTDYIIHPAFTTNAGLGGGWEEELPGIWIGKYEASSVEGNSDDSNDNVTTKHVKVQPGVSSWRNIQIGNMYTVSQNYEPNLKSHMLKNSEWGAVAYLTESKYGRNGEEIGYSNQGYITGGGEGNAYIENNQSQSTTGNVYGIYDMRGGAVEYVASYYKDGNLSSAGGTFTNGVSNEFSTVYTGTSASSAYKYGDATYETSGWHGDYAAFVSSSEPFFLRGGSYSNFDSDTGVFFFSILNRLRLPQLFVSPRPGSVMCNLLSEQLL